MTQIDEKDHAILDVLKENSSLSIQQISKKIAIPIATVHNRIKRMKSNGIIQKYTIVVDKAKLGKKMVAYILIKAMPKIDQPALLEKLMKNELVEDGAVVAGQFDLIIKVRVADITELDWFAIKHLRTFDDISQTQSMIAYRNVTKV